MSPVPPNTARSPMGAYSEVAGAEGVMGGGVAEVQVENHCFRPQMIIVT